MYKLDHAVAELLRDVGRSVVFTRFRKLAAGEVHEKTPGEIVTAVDHEAEEILTERLAALLPESRVIGEEACEDDPSLIEGLDRGIVWLVDPLDGTANFAAGKPPFGLIIALAEDGVTKRGWLYDPLTDRLCHAALGEGAFIDGRRLRSAAPGASRAVATLATQFMPANMAETVRGNAALHFDLKPIPRCAAAHYPMLCEGETHVAMFQRTLPWDHAAGALLLTEAGGYISRWDGSPYRFYDDGFGIVAASDETTWMRAMTALNLDDDAMPQLRNLLPQKLEAAAYVTARRAGAKH